MQVKTLNISDQQGKSNHFKPQTDLCKCNKMEKVWKTTLTEFRIYMDKRQVLNVNAFTFFREEATL